MKNKLVLEDMDLARFGFTTEDDFLLVSDPPYPYEWFEEEPEEERELYDIHAGAFETAVLGEICPRLVDFDKALTLTSYSLTEEGLGKWLAGKKPRKKLCH